MSSLLAKLEPRDLADLVLTDGVTDDLAALLDEYRYRAELEKHKIKPRSRLLLHGPPGCGKSSLAAAIGGALRKPVVALRLAAASGSHMGETGRNLDLAVTEVTRLDALLLLDELDAVGTTRSASDTQAAAKEQNQVVCALLQLLDLTKIRFLVGATNRVDMIDPALRRRFDCEIELPAPTEDAAALFSAEVFERHDWPPPAEWPCPLASFDAIEKAVVREVRAGVIKRAKGAS
jgi:SpoVK/Ycf46/Vps4 family AAA+-type ATPase